MDRRISDRRSNSRCEDVRQNPDYPDGGIHGHGLFSAPGEQKKKIEFLCFLSAGVKFCSDDNIGKKDYSPWFILTRFFLVSKEKQNRKLLFLNYYVRKKSEFLVIEKENNCEEKSCRRRIDDLYFLSYHRPRITCGDPL